MADNSFTHLVVVGSSAGGITALSGLVSSLPDDFDAPIVVAQHLDPNRESHLQEILARRSPLPVKTVTEHEPLQAGVVFVVPANRHVNITDSEIGLSSEPSSGLPMPSINLLMETAAKVYGESLIAVVLSGTGTDGTEGARTVSQAGGTVIIQDPETAEFGEMPRSLAPSTVDIVNSLEKIGPILKNLISGIAVPEESSEDEGRYLERLLDELHRNRGVEFRSYKRPTMLRRLGRRMAATNCASLDEYSSYVEEHPEEYKQLMDALLIKVTEFFRDPDLFDHLKEEVLPGLFEEAREGENQLRIWSAGCATGEEAYSLAILVSEVLSSRKKGPHRPRSSPSKEPPPASPAICGSPATPGLPRTEGNGRRACSSSKTPLRRCGYGGSRRRTSGSMRPTRSSASSTKNSRPSTRSHW